MDGREEEAVMATLEQYLSWPGEHFTTLRHILTSPRAYSHARLNGIKDSDTLRQGRAGHSAILEPDRFAADFVVWDAQSSDGRSAPRRGARWEGFLAAAGKRTVITPRQHAAALAMTDAVHSHPLARDILTDEEGRAEVPFQWTDRRRGIQCKTRMDWLTGGRMVEIKTCADPSPSRFASAAARLHYPMQLAMYHAAALADGLGWRVPTIIAVQSVAPWDVVVYSIPTETLDHGAEEFEEALDQLERCRMGASWPGQAPTAEVELRLPPWATGPANITFGDVPMFGAA
jgi:hypothetical protein